MNDSKRLTYMAKKLYEEEKNRDRLDGWFYIKRIQKKCDIKYAKLSLEQKAAYTLYDVCSELPLSISDYTVFVGTQRDAFARSYALINPNFKIETFEGYCDPTAVFSDITPNETIHEEEIKELLEYAKQSDYVTELLNAYREVEQYTGEVAFFVEQVTGHTIADMRPILKYGVEHMIGIIEDKIRIEPNEEKRDNYQAFKISLEAVLVLTKRYRQLVLEKAKTVDSQRAKELHDLAQVLDKISQKGASNLFEAIQSFILMWQVMCIEQAPNPFAFSVGNADRIFDPYIQGIERELVSAMFKHLLVFYNVGDRSWAISQNLIVGGKSSKDGEDMTCDATYALLDAYYDMNLPQPILSIKLHNDTPDKLYEELGKFFFTEGTLTPSLFNDESMYKVLRRSKIEEADLEDYAIAGCQEPLIMGKDNGNTTNSWLNLAKILELTLNNGVSLLTGKFIGTYRCYHDELELLENIESIFYQNLEYYVDKMVDSANKVSKAISNLRVPFLSTMMGGLDYGYDLRDTNHQGTKYNGSGCLIHGLSVVADSFVVIKDILKHKPEYTTELIQALRVNFEGHDALYDFIQSRSKYGNNQEKPDCEMVRLSRRVSNIISSKTNYLNQPFRPDFSTPSTHLLYGYLVGATPDGRKEREMLGYGVDPLFGEAHNGLGFRMLSTMKLPFENMQGGYASHFGIDPKFFKTKTYEEKGIEFKEKIIQPLFFNVENEEQVAPFYLYVNVTTPEILRKVLDNPKKYAPNGVYIMRIHGTFVNFLDLSSAIQEDIIMRLDLNSTKI